MKIDARMGSLISRRARMDGTDCSGAIRDLLTDIRHLCDSKGIDFHERLDASYEVYLEERGADERLEGKRAMASEA